MKKHIFLTVAMLVLGLTVIFGTQSAMAVDLTPDSDLEAYLLFGNKTRTDGGMDNSNNYGSGKVRYRPNSWLKKVGDVNVKMGLFGVGQYGAGEAGNVTKADYSWTKLGGGVTSRISTDNYWSLKIDVGAAYLGGKSDTDKSTDYLLLVSADYRIEQRRAKGTLEKKPSYKTLFPCTDIHAEWDQAVSSKRESNTGASLKTNENGARVISVTQAIVDVEVAPGHVITPAVLVGGGQIGVKDKFESEYEYGARLGYRYKGTDIVGVNYTERHIPGVDQKDRRTTVDLQFNF
jgi:hypothetical protein